MTTLRTLFAAAALLAIVAPASAHDFGGGQPGGFGQGGQSGYGQSGYGQGGYGQGGGHSGIPSELTQPASFAPCGPYHTSTDVAVVNEGRGEIWYVQMSPVEDDSYGDDLLGPQEVISTGGYSVVSADNPTGTCRFDVLITYASGTELALWNVDLCASNVIYATENRYELDYDRSI